MGDQSGAPKRNRFPWGKAFLIAAWVYLGATFALGCYTFLYAQGASYLSDDPRACATSQWRLDFVSAENSMGFHASQEAARILGEAIDYGRRGQLTLSE